MVCGQGGLLHLHTRCAKHYEQNTYMQTPEVADTSHTPSARYLQFDLPNARGSLRDETQALETAFKLGHVTACMRGSCEGCDDA